MQAARHTTTKNADKYCRDAKSIVHVQAAQDDGLENRVSKWKSNFLDNSMTVRGVMTGTNEIDLPTLAKNFVLQELKVSDQSKINHPCYLAKASCHTGSQHMSESSLKCFVKCSSHRNIHN